MTVDLQQHLPVLLASVLDCLQPIAQKTIVDATFGGGGYSQALLEAGAAKVIAFDRDPDAIQRAQIFSNNYSNKFEIIHACFSELKNYVKPNSVDAVVFDFGVSSFQIDTPSRGFSFQAEGPLNMQMGIGSKLTAAVVVNTFKEQDLADIIFNYGDEPRAYQIARAIIKERETKPFVTTLQLANVVRKHAAATVSIDRATKTFQAIRIFVNEELREIDSALKACQEILKTNGQLITVTFHSLEDRLVKQVTKNKWFANLDDINLNNEATQSAYDPTSADQNNNEQNSNDQTNADQNKQNDNKGNVEFCWQPQFKKPLTPSLSEIDHNPRARSAKLRSYSKAIYSKVY